MKKAFTMLEIIMVIVIVGILAFVFRPNFGRDGLIEAANQVARDIRYTQHLALSDNRFDNSNQEWYKERWQIIFHSDNGSDGKEAYSIFSDNPSYTGSPSTTEVAINPYDNTKILSGGFGTNDSSKTTKSLNLGATFGISDVEFSNSCSAYNSKVLFFDQLGRPFYRKPNTSTLSYDSSRYMTSTCIITLTHQDGRQEDIYIEPESGYVHIGRL
jgi:prepilin-type N-terminal cleavage/methylation domain-containing protein